jgi:Phytanoyl-CoA dioxygenase (PhyH)
MIISQSQWAQYEKDGYLKLGKVLGDAELLSLQTRIDDIMMGRASIDYSRILMQLDSETGKYEDAGEQSMGFKGASPNYRKIQELEQDDLFLAYTQRPLFREICTRTYGPEASVASFRAMFMNKPARKGTFLPWHQDRWVYLDRDPKITVWTALDPATIANGCVQVIPGSHKEGLLNPSHPSGFLAPEQAKQWCTPDKTVYLELQPGEAVLLHNWLLHASEVNKTDIPRRAYSVCYMDAATVDRNGRSYPIIFGEGAIRPRSRAGEVPAAAVRSLSSEFKL